MKLEDQVVSLELAKRLKELGVRQESAFYWVQRLLNGAWYVHYWHPDHAVADDEYAAYTVAELGEVLKGEWIPHKKDNGTWANYDVQDKPFETFENEADARAAMLCHLLETKLITVEVNGRLA